MKSAIRIAALTFAFTTIGALAQTKEVDVKDSPAAQTLNKTAKTLAADQKALDVQKTQAQSALDQSNKSLSDEIASITKSMNEDLAKDKRYKPRIDRLNDLQKKLNENNSIATAAFNQSSGALQKKVQDESAQIDGLISVVRQENGLPDNAVFDRATQKWSVPEKK